VTTGSAISKPAIEVITGFFEPTGADNSKPANEVITGFFGPCPRDVIPEPWLSFLTELDSIATATVRLNCIGGFVVTMLYGLDRPTGDVDVLEIAPRSAADAFARVAMLGGTLFRKYGIYLDFVTVAQPPFEYESRLQEMFPGTFQHLRLMALDPYDLALAKLERNIRQLGRIRA